MEKLVYICHPIGGDIDANLKDLYRILRKIALCGNVHPFAPYISEFMYLSDDNPTERAIGLGFTLDVIAKIMPDQVWLTGTHISKGMNAEAHLAAQLNIPIINCINKI